MVKPGLFAAYSERFPEKPFYSAGYDEPDASIFC